MMSSCVRQNKGAVPQMAGCGMLLLCSAHPELVHFAYHHWIWYIFPSFSGSIWGWMLDENRHVSLKATVNADPV